MKIKVLIFAVVFLIVCSNVFAGGLSESVEDYYNKTDKYNELNSINEKLILDIGILEKDIVELDKSISDKEDRIETKEEDIKEMEGKIEDTQENIAELKTKISEVKNLNEKQILKIALGSTPMFILGLFLTTILLFYLWKERWEG
ncbi:MAG: hypothetical protein A7315_02275 [Candidatus Altiarchaeales archaeon WOR_SM1_79]|nr:MAG: hypothetical protein A7315_02275 [Candidatus Altiarchaeales archaeon WOR_SM1_79]